MSEKYTIDIYEDIGTFRDWFTGENLAFDFNDMVGHLKSIDSNTPLSINVNSYGGSVLQGLSIYNSIKGHKAQTTANIVGYAMSISSVIPLAADVVNMADNAWIVIHEARVFDLHGEFVSDDLVAVADQLEAHNKNIAKIYASKMGISKKEARDMMRGERWIDAQEAKKIGLVDNITKGVQIAAKVELKDFKNIPAQAKIDIQNTNNKMDELKKLQNQVNAFNGVFGITEENKDKVNEVLAAFSTKVEKLNGIDVDAFLAKVEKLESLEEDAQTIDGMAQKVSDNAEALKVAEAKLIEFDALSEENKQLKEKIEELEAVNVEAKASVAANSEFISMVKSNGGIVTQNSLTETLSNNGLGAKMSLKSPTNPLAV